MKLRHTTPTMLAVIAAVAATSCVDNDYDLSDIDTTVRIDVNDLTIPVNLDEILLENIIEEGDRIKIVDGRYVITEDGSFESSQIRIGAVSVASQTFNPTVLTLPFVPEAAAADIAGRFDVEAPVETYRFTADDIPAEITGIEALGADLRFVFTFDFQGLSAVARRVEIHDLALQLPKGLTLADTDGGSYDSTTGLITFPVKQFDGSHLELAITASRLDIDAMGAVFDTEARTLRASGDFCVRKAALVINSADIIPGATPASVTLTIGYGIPDFNISTFSGRVKYDITGVDISDIDLSDLPDVLSQKGTDISIVNPCIFIAVGNPLAGYNLAARTGFTITAHHDADVVGAYSIDNPYFTITGGDAQGRSAYCLSPSQPVTVPDGYASPAHVPFTSLSRVLSGDGMPSRLSVTLDDPNIYDQPVTDLPLGIDIGRVSGDYSFFAPIALCDGSKIVYADDIDGWSSEDLDCLTITELHIRATLTSDIPLALDVKAYPIDADGNQIGSVEIKGASLLAGPQPQPVDIYITGSIRGLDGIRYEAVATADDQQQTLTPDMHIRVTQLRPTATGYYEKEL